MPDDQTPETPEEVESWEDSENLNDVWIDYSIEELNGLSDIDRAKLGSKVWNAWAYENMKEFNVDGQEIRKGTNVDFSKSSN